MSARLLRRVLEQQEQQLKHANADSEVETDEEPNPSIAPAPFRNPFDLLHDEEDEQEVDGKGTTDVAEQDISVPVDKSTPDLVPLVNRKSKKKKKKKGKEDSTNTKHGDEGIDDLIDIASMNLSNSFNPDEQQHDSRNMRAGAAEVQKNTKKQGTLSILNVDPKYLKAENELRKIFGSKVVSSFENHHNVGSSRPTHGGKRASQNSRRTVLVSPSSYWPRWDGSLSMEFLETKDGIHYFRYMLSPSQSHTQEALEAAKAIHDLNAIAHILARYPYQIEALLIFAEVFRFSGEHQSSADAIGKCLYALECAWHPQFTPLQGNCQLKYSHDTNKSLFSALFSHMKNLDRRGCHRSALEVCKLLLSLDSDDPLGALFCIDYFALRAQEFAWLEQFSEEYRNDNSIWLFPNFSYSLAICRFYLEKDAASKETIRENEKATAVDMMKQALMLHPLVLKKLVAKAPMKDTAWNQILKHSIFGSAQAGSPSLDRLIKIYVERNYVMWRLPELQSFLKEVALQVIESLKRKGSEAKDWACVRKEAFSSEQDEYSHLLVSDFSDTVPSLPPEELRHFMVAPNMVHDLQDDHVGANLDGAQAVQVPREVTGRNAAVVFLESLLPWVNYGPNRNGGLEDGDIED